MGELPVSEEAKAMSRKIDQIFDFLRIQESILSQLLIQLGKQSGEVKMLPALERKLNEMADSLAIIEELAKFK